jgi:KaiC/GvpD/RAD55 family RecA-like ATPase
MTVRNTKSAMDIIRLPPELGQFLRQPSYSLAIKGRAGTGKTCLALTILGEARTDQNRLYISTRMATSELQKYYPWISDLNKNEDGTSEASELSEESSIFVDARLDEPTAFFERITNELMDTSSPTIVIDTWDAIGDFMDREAFVTNAKILQVWRQRAQGKIIFIIENVEDKTFDNLVDGIIELEEVDVDSRKTRRIHLSKLRGVKINRPWYMFSLNQGVFHCYDPYRPTDFANMAPVSSAGNLFDSKSLLIRTGFQELDDLLGGGIPRKSIVNIEIDKDVDPRIALRFMSGLIRDYAVSGNPVVLEPPIGISDENLERILKAAVSDSRSRKLVRIFRLDLGSSRRNTNENIIKFLDKLIVSIQGKGPKKKLLCILCFSPFENESHSGSSELASRSNYDLLVLINYSRDAKLEQARGIADVTLRIREIEGTIFLQPGRPWASLFAIVQDEHSKGMALDQMV